jgi:hypothetical protein
MRGVPWEISEEIRHRLSGWDATEEEFLWQMQIESKPNEITSAPVLTVLRLSWAIKGENKSNEQRWEVSNPI